MAGRRLSSSLSACVRVAGWLAAGQLPGKVSKALMLDAAMRTLAGKLKGASSLLFFGRGYNYATALEAALKVGLDPKPQPLNPKPHLPWKQ